MKYLLALSLLFVGCNQFTIPKPRYARSQKITYVVPDFYRLVCSGKGMIEEVTCYNECIYVISTPSTEKGCPSTLQVEEKDIK